MDAARGHGISGLRESNDHFNGMFSSCICLPVSILSIIAVLRLQRFTAKCPHVRKAVCDDPSVCTFIIEAPMDVLPMPNRKETIKVVIISYKRAIRLCESQVCCSS